MSLVVVVAEGDAPATLLEQLDTLGYETVHAVNPRLAADLCARQQATLVVVTRREDAEYVCAEQPRVPVVMLFDGELEKDQLLQIMRVGVADVWELPLSEGLLQERITLLRHRSEAQVVQAERSLAQHLADLERDQRAGRYIQMGMLPPNPMAIDQYRFTHRIEPSLILSGDFVDYFRITDQHFGLYVADVSGHGASSAFVTVLLKNFSRRLRREYRPSMLTNPGEVMQWLNGELLEQKIDKHVTLFFAIGDLQQNTLSVVNAGHYPPAILVTDQGARMLDMQGKPVGLFDEVDYECQTISFNVGDRLVVFSDGVFEIMTGQNLSENEQLLQQFATIEPTIDGLWTQIVGSNRPANPDDMTCLIMARET